MGNENRRNRRNLRDAQFMEDMTALTKATLFQQVTGREKSVYVFGSTCGKSTLIKKMSDEWENDKNLSFSENINKYRSELNNNDRENFDKKRHNIYWQTLIVCISYALIAIIIFVFLFIFYEGRSHG